LGAGYPQRVTAAGGRFHFKDDWEFYDTLETSFDYGDCMITWEGRSCQGMKVYNRDRGVAVMGTPGRWWSIATVTRFTTSRQQDWRICHGKTTSSADAVGRDSMTDLHFANLSPASVRTKNCMRPSLSATSPDHAATLEHRLGDRARTAS